MLFTEWFNSRGGEVRPKSRIISFDTCMHRRSNWPAVSSNWPAVSSNWLAVSSNWPAVSSNWPAVSSNWPAVSRKTPAVNTNQFK